MKYVVVLGDGMADRPIEKLGVKTCLEYANTPNMDKLAPHAELGLFRTVPKGFAPGSDVANMSVMGFDPAKYYTGRSPLEAVAMGINSGWTMCTYTWRDPTSAAITATSNTRYSLSSRSTGSW